MAAQATAALIKLKPVWGDINNTSLELEVKLNGLTRSEGLLVQQR